MSASTTRVLFAALLAALLAPAAARAAAVGTVSGAPGAYSFTGTGDRNELRFGELAGPPQVVFEELNPDNTIGTSAPGCSSQEPREVRCVSQSGSVNLLTGDGSDLVVLGGRTTSLTVTVFGGPGDDSILAANGAGEVVDCGEGFDMATVDPADVLVACELGIRDADGDGSLGPVDCDDGDPSIRPGVGDIPGNGVDEDCDGRDEPLARLDTRARAGWRVFRTHTQAALLSVGPVPADATVHVRCSGRGCPFKLRRRIIARNTPSVNLTRPFRGRKLRRGTLIRIRVTKPGTIGRVFRWKMRRGRLPDLDSLCLPPGSRPRAC
jgi:Putative metal-binding motif